MNVSFTNCPETELAKPNVATRDKCLRDKCLSMSLIFMISESSVMDELKFKDESVE